VECLSPFDFWRSGGFESAYLAGFSAQHWDVPAGEMEERAKKIFYPAAASRRWRA